MYDGEKRRWAQYFYSIVHESVARGLLENDTLVHDGSSGTLLLGELGTYQGLQWLGWPVEA
jgi:hypothetical protein